jgi:NADH-quinone oxidoreductase subunit H
MSIQNIWETVTHWILLHIPLWVVITIVIHLLVLGGVAYMILLERKIASWVQDRIGPNRVGLGFGIIPFLKDFHFWGLGQPLADGLKFIMKEDYRARGIDKILFTVAPGVMIITIIISIAVIPWGGTMQAHTWIDVTSAVHKGQDPAQAAEDALPNSYYAAAPENLDVSSVPMAKRAEAYSQAVKDNIWIEKIPQMRGPSQIIAHITYRIPFQIASLNIGVLYVLATLSLAVYGVVVGGWASNNKYSFLGGLRATANMISYEIPMGLAVLCIVTMYGTLDLGQIVDMQAHDWHGIIPAWNIFTQPLAFLMFLICIHAEANRAPFDTAEAEQELVGGYHTEYSSMRFALFFLAEYAGMVTTSAVLVALFLGGWHLPWGLTGGIDKAHPEVTASLLMCVFRTFVFLVKTLGIIFIFMWVRWSLPRFRFDQIMMLAWRALIPLSLAMLMMTAIVLYLMRDHPRPNFWIDGQLAVVFLIANVVLLALTMLISRALPPPPATNRKIAVPGSRYARTPLPAA